MELIFMDISIVNMSKRIKEFEQKHNVTNVLVSDISDGYRIFAKVAYDEEVCD